MSSSKLDLNIFVINTRGYKNNEDYILHKIIMYDIGFIMETWLDETHWKEVKLKIETKKRSAHFIRCFPRRKNRGRRAGGLMWVISQSINHVTKITNISCRISLCEIMLKNSNWSIFGVYMPCESGENYDAIMGDLSNAIRDRDESNQKFMIIGDFNADVFRTRAIDHKYRGWCRELQATTIDVQYTQPTPNSFRNGRGDHSHIDHVLLIKPWKWYEIRQVNIILGPNETWLAHQSSNWWHEQVKGIWDPRNAGDHRPLEIMCEIDNDELTLRSNKPTIKKIKIDWSSEDHKNMYSSELEKLLRKIDFKEILKASPEELEFNTQTVILLLIGKMKQALEAVENELKNRRKNPFVKCKKFWTRELAKLREARQKAADIYIQRRSIENKVALNIASTEFRKGLRHAKADAANSTAIKHGKIHKESPIKYWQEIRRLSDRGPSPNIDRKTLESFYEKALNESNETNENNIRIEEDLKRLAEQIRAVRGRQKVKIEEIAKIINKLKNGKAPGPMGVRNEQFKYAKLDKVSEAIALIFETIINNGIMPTIMNVGILNPIVKDQGGDITSTNNTRPITISDTIANIFEQYCMAHIGDGIATHELQFGFKKNASTCHGIYLLKELLRHVKKEKEKIYMLYLDFSKAFDRVNRALLLQKMIPVMSPHMWLALYKYYEISTVFIAKCVDDKSVHMTPKRICVKKGVKQGGPFSPQGWAWLINDMIQQLLNSGTVYERGNLRALMLYADDTACGHDSIAKAQKALDIISEFCRLNEIKINESKTVWMKLGENYKKDRDGNPVVPEKELHEKLMVNGMELNKVTIFKYLGAWISSNNKNNYHLAARSKAAWGGIGELKKLGFYNENLRPKVKGVLLQAYFRARLTYAIESLDLTQNSMSELIKMERKTIRKAFNLNGKSKIEEIYHAMGVRSLNEAMEKRDLTFLLQLLNNKATASVVTTSKTNSKHEKLLNKIGFEYSSEETLTRNIAVATVKCTIALNKYIKEQKDKKPSELARAIEQLLETGKHEDRSTVRLLMNYDNRFRVR
jgi:hypothetical protein